MDSTHPFALAPSPSYLAAPTLDVFCPTRPTFSCVVDFRWSPTSVVCTALPSRRSPCSLFRRRVCLSRLEYPRTLMYRSCFVCSSVRLLRSSHLCDELSPASTLCRAVIPDTSHPRTARYVVHTHAQCSVCARPFTSCTHYGDDTHSA